MPLIAVVYALFSALFHSSSVVTLRPLFRDRATPEAASLYTLSVGTGITGVWLAANLTFAITRESINVAAVAYFVLSGVMGAGIARVANYHAVKILGATRGNLLVNSSPLFVLPMAALLLSEAITPSKLGGAILVFAAILILSLETEAPWTLNLARSYARRGIVLGIFAALLYTLARLSRKIGIDYAFAPVTASFVANLTALSVVSSASIVSPNLAHRVKIDRAVLKSMLAAGLFQALGQIFEFVSYGSADASLVVPVRSSTPLLTACLSYLFIRRYEEITRHLILAVLIGFLGIVVLSLGA